jgi:PAS domain S-box-containing protein
MTPRGGDPAPATPPMDSPICPGTNLEIDAQLRAVWETAADALALTDPEGRILAINPAASELSGYAAEELVGHEFVVVFPEPLWEWARARHRDAFYAPIAPPPMEAPLTSRDGRGLIVEARITYVMQNQERVAMLSITRDVTEQKRAAAALQLSEERFRVGLRHAPVLVFQHDRDLRYTWIDKPLPGRHPEQVLGHTDADLLPPSVAEPLMALKREVLASGKAARRELQSFSLEERGVGWSDLTVEPLHDASGRLVGLMGAAFDITSRIIGETLQRETIAMVTHDLRNPLSAILAYAEMLQRPGVADPSFPEKIVAQARHMTRLLRDLSDFTHLATRALPLACETMDLVATARGAIEQAQAQTSLHTLRLVTTATELVGCWDADRVLQVFENLLSNAIKFSPEGGEITVHLEATEQEVLVGVQDTGLGIPAAVMPRLFDRFYRAEAVAQRIHGQGLGLAITRGLIEAHGGRIWAESDGEGQGSTFWFVLPRQPWPPDPE